MGLGYSDCAIGAGRIELGDIEVKMAIELKDYLTADVVYAKLGFPSKEALLKACQRREVPHIRRSPRVVLFDPDEVNRFLKERMVEARRRKYVF